MGEQSAVGEIVRLELTRAEADEIKAMAVYPEVGCRCVRCRRWRAIFRKLMEPKDDHLRCVVKRELPIIERLGGSTSPKDAVLSASRIRKALDDEQADITSELIDAGRHLGEENVTDRALAFVNDSEVMDALRELREPIATEKP